MRVMHEPIEDGVPKGGVTHEVMPVVDGDLAGDERSPATDTVFDKLQEVAAFAIA